jgi:hypothetical protein
MLQHYHNISKQLKIFQQVNMHTYRLCFNCQLMPQYLRRVFRAHNQRRGSKNINSGTGYDVLDSSGSVPALAST